MCINYLNNINRDYNPITGRYIQSDPIGLDGGFSIFVYVNGNPVMFVDLEGLFGGSDSPKIGRLTTCEETSAFATTKESNDLYSEERFTNILSSIEQKNYYNKLRTFHTPCIANMAALVFKEMINGERGIPNPASWIIKSVYIGKTIGDPKIEVQYFKDKIEIWRMK